MSKSWTIGSNPTCDLVVDSPKVSGRHCRLTREDKTYYLEDLQSTNGTFINGLRVAGMVSVTKGDSITLGVLLPMPWPDEEVLSEAIILRIGREPDNDLVMKLPMVSSHHARIVWEGKPGEATIEDLRSSNGTAVGSPDRKIDRAVFSVADTIYFGTHAVPASHLLAHIDRSFAQELTVQGIEVVVGRDPGCDQVIDLPQVSGRHARFVRSSEGTSVEDLGSSNGTYVGGIRIEGPVTVGPGSVISLGTCSIVLAVESARPVVDQDTPLESVESQAAPSLLAISTEVSEHPSLVLSGELKPTSSHPWRFAGLILQAPILAIAIVAASRSIAMNLAGLSLAAIWFGLSQGVLGRLVPAKSRVEDHQTQSSSILLSRLGLTGLICIGQCVVAWAIVAIATGLKAHWPTAIGLMVLASAVGLALGLLLMALAPRPAVGRAMLLPTMLLFWLLGGEYRAVPELPPGVRPFATLTPSRWEFEGLILLEARAVPDPPGGDDLAEAFFPAETDRMGTTADALALGLMLIGLAAPTGFIAAKVLPVSKGLRASPAAPGRGDGP